MTSFQSHIILNEVQNLINYSCQGNRSDIARFNTMHSAFIKKHFHASEVVIHNEKEEIDMKIPDKENDFVNICLKCPDLEGFLISCIGKDSDSLAFYENMLSYYIENWEQ